MYSLNQRALLIFVPYSPLGLLQLFVDNTISGGSIGLNKGSQVITHLEQISILGIKSVFIILVLKLLPGYYSGLTIDNYCGIKLRTYINTQIIFKSDDQVFISSCV